jgi:predicted negative regulator of RcsB-dependent stress response
MIMKKLLFIFALVSLCLPAFSQDNEMVQAKRVEIHIGGKIVKGYSVKYKGGKVHLQISTGPGTTAYRADQIDMIKAPMPSELKMVNGWIKTGQFDKVVKVISSPKGKLVYDEQQFLGWGKRFTFGYCYSLIKMGRVADAEPLLRKTAGLVAGIEDKADKQMIEMCKVAIDVAKKKYSAGKSKLVAQVKKLEAECKPYFYNLQGDILKAENKAQEALIAYYKTFLLDRSNPWERGYAKAKITEVYKATNDPRASAIKNLR